jgi:hypothetical protein
MARAVGPVMAVGMPYMSFKLQAIDFVLCP